MLNDNTLRVLGRNYMIEIKKIKWASACVAVLFLFSNCSVLINASDSSSTFYDDDQHSHVSVQKYANTIELDYTFDFSEPEITEILIDGTLYHQVTMENLPPFSEVGCPILPMKTVSVILPQKGEVKSIDVHGEGQISLGDGYNVEVRDCLVSTDGLYEITLVDNFDYSIAYPIELYHQQEIQYIKGYSLLVLNLFPVSYIGESGDLYYYEQMNVTVTVTQTGSVNPLFRNLQRDEESLLDLVDDTSMLSTYISLPEHPLPPSLINPEDTYDYVIITSETLKNDAGDYSFQTFRDYKIARGTHTTIISVEEIYDHYEGADDQEKIRNFIIDAYIWWECDYILLGGDDAIIPARIVNFKGLIDFLNLSYTMSTDLYYACLDGDYDANGNGTFGEVGDLVDYFAEVAIGRACVEYASDVSKFVYKTLSYIESTDTYLEKVWMVGEMLSTYPVWGGDELDTLIDGCIKYGFITVGIPSNIYDIQTLYDRDWAEHGWTEPYPGDPNTGWPKEEIIGHINNGTHIINHDGHASNHWNMKMEISDVMQLTNDKYFFEYSSGCFSGIFNYGDCIAEFFTVKTNHGAFAGIWNTAEGWGWSDIPTGPSLNFHRQFWHAILGKNIREIGKANQYSKEKNFKYLFIPMFGFAHKIVYFSLTLFGDPQVNIKIPEDFEGWVSPTNHIDAMGTWDDEPLSYDFDTYTKASCKIYDNNWIWTPWLELLLDSTINFSKIRFNAWHSWLYCDKIDIDWTYPGGQWYCLYDPDWGAYMDTFTYPSNQWKELYYNPYEDSHEISKVRVRFHCRSGLWSYVTADLHEFQFCEVI